MRKLILRNSQSPGDIVMLTAAVRDLHRSHPGCFQTDVRTLWPDLWKNNPFITPLDEENTSVEQIYCHYPLIHSSNSGPWHFIHGFPDFLAERLGVKVRPTLFKGDIHLDPQEKEEPSQVQEHLGKNLPFWILVGGGKQDFTIKWWSRRRFQEVVDHFRGRILFVQVGEQGHVHPALERVLDLRGKTTLRQLVRLVHHVQGVLCPVTLAMHLAAAVETRPGRPSNRACVVVAGGREPAQWEAYPHHQFLHTNGMLSCCDNGGCWKARTVPLLDSDEKDLAGNLCMDVIPEGLNPSGSIQASKNAHGYPQEEWPNLLPRCMSLITVEDVIRRIELYFQGGRLNYLSPEEAKLVESRL